MASIELLREHRTREGLHIEGNGISIEIIVRKIGGTVLRRTAELDVLVGNESGNLYLPYQGCLVNVFGDINIKIATEEEIIQYWSKSKNPSKAAVFYYQIPEEYKFRIIYRKDTRERHE